MKDNIYDYRNYGTCIQIIHSNYNKTNQHIKTLDFIKVFLKLHVLIDFKMFNYGIEVLW